MIYAESTLQCFDVTYDKQLQILFHIEPNTRNVAKNKNPHEFLRLNTVFTDG